MESYQESLFANIIEEVGVDFIHTSAGTWFNAFKNIIKGINKLGIDSDKIKNMISYQIITHSKDIIKCVEESKVISIRNDYLGHGPIGSHNEIYKIENDEVEKVNDDLLNKIAESLQGFRLININNYKKINNIRYAQVKKLMGENRDFIIEEIVIPKELDTEKVILTSNDFSKSVILDPLLHLGVCSECGSENIFFYDKREKEKIMYFSHLHHHKPYFDLLEEVKKILPFERR
jgi:hypothetical protein